MGKGQGYWRQKLRDKLSPECDFGDQINQQPHDKRDCVEMKHEVVQNEKSDDNNGEPNGDGVGHVGKLGQVGRRCKRTWSAK
jgi:hypothetical protein